MFILIFVEVNLKIALQENKNEQNFSKQNLTFALKTNRLIASHALRRGEESPHNVEHHAS